MGRDGGKLGAVVVSLVGLVLGRGVFADCSGGPAFPHTIVPQDSDAFVWGVPEDIDHVRGDLSGLNTYATWIRGSSAAATMLDLTDDHPSPGSGVFYLVKLSAPPCGSWQTGVGTEPNRDTDILPSCEESNPAEADIQAAVDTAVVGLNNPWGDPVEFAVMYERTQRSLNCAISIDEMGSASSRLNAPDSQHCNTTYCPSIQYCGIKNSSEQTFGTHPASQCLNQACFDHDECYRTGCVLGDGEQCVFSPRSDACDATLSWRCSLCNQIDIPYSNDWRNDLIVCDIASALKLIQKASACDNPACDDAGQTCDGLAGVCRSDPSALNWLDVSLPVTDFEINGIWASGPSNVIMVGQRFPTAVDRNLALHFDGSAWVVGAGLDQPGAALYSVWGSSATNVFAGESGGMIYLFDGSVWEAQINLGAPVSSIWGNSEVDVWAVGGNAVKHFDGVTWSPVAAPGNPPIRLEAGWSAPGCFYAAGAPGDKIYRYDGGAWTDIPIGATSINEIWGRACNDFFVTGREFDRGVLFHCDATACQELCAGQLPIIWGVSGTEEDVFAVGERIVHWDGETCSHWYPDSGFLFGVWATTFCDVHVGGVNVALHSECSP